MKNFTYYDTDKASLHLDNCDWLKDTGLRETHWILDATWIFSSYYDITFKEWISKK